MTTSLKTTLYRTKNNSIFDSDCDAIINYVNCVGTINVGLASQFKSHFPENYETYRQQFLKHPSKLRIERLLVTENPSFCRNRFIINVATQNGREPTTLDFVTESFDKLRYYLSQSSDIESVALTKPDGLDWNDFEPIIVDMVEKLPNIVFEVHL